MMLSFLEIILLFVDSDEKDNTIFGTASIKQVFHKYHHLYKVFVFFLKFTLTIVEPLSATSALPGSHI